MNYKFNRFLAKVPCVGENHYNELSQIIDKKMESTTLTCSEKERLQYELKVIKETGSAKLFLFVFNALKNFSVGECCFFGKENNCFINYLLGFTSVNPVKYKLQFELFFNPERAYYPVFCFYIKKGTRERLLNSICDCYKITRLIKGNDNVCRYFIDIDDKMNIKQEKNDCERTSYAETTAEISAAELSKRGLFEFDVLEYEDNKIVAKEFSDEEVFNEAIRTVAYKPAILSLKPFEKIDEIKEILNRTEGKLIFQEQVVEILNKVCGLDPVESDCIRKSICTKEQDYNKEVATILHNKFGTDGDEFFDYLRSNGLYTVSEGYVIARMKNDVVWEKE